jgi:hypothetical protein
MFVFVAAGLRSYLVRCLPTTPPLSKNAARLLLLLLLLIWGRLRGETGCHHQQQLQGEGQQGQKEGQKLQGQQGEVLHCLASPYQGWGLLLGQWEEEEEEEEQEEGRN